ncbi:MAG TPA: HAD-IIIA family hydrolase [bacterium]|nr:HAD-IIIA family hydrolase [bacterium]
MIEDKIKTRDELGTLCEHLRASGKKIGFTSGAFDIVHAGHADYLEKAKGICDVLIVGVNSDRSVQSYKGPGRPVVPDAHRVRVVAALESVDYVFLFDERRNRENIGTLRPHYYIKAGDYSHEDLTSRSTAEEYGGEVRLIPVTQSISTTRIIEKIRDGGDETSSRVLDEDGATHITQRPARKAPAVFFDRDGTINEEVLYLHEPEKFRLLPNAAAGIRMFQDMGYRIVIVSNQPGIGMGYFGKEDFYAVNREMLRQLSDVGVLVDKIYFCPHSKSEQCDCRKPGQALIRRAEKDLNIDLTRSVFVGDKTSDMETGRRAGMKIILVNTGFRGEDGEFQGEPDARAEDLLDAASQVLAWERDKAPRV